VDKKALNDKFSKEILSSIKLSDIDYDQSKNKKPIYFNSISQMEDYFQSLFEPQEKKTKTIKQIETELNLKLDELLKAEQYEDAACLRDYMVMKGFKRKF
jgi:protein-arginine kinase activator protein McsA